MRYNALVERLRQGKPIHGMLAVRCKEIDSYNQRRDPAHMLVVRDIDDQPEDPPASAYRFRLPQHYLNIDLDRHLADRLVEQFPDLPDRYVDRLVLEMEMMRARQMEDLIRTLIYMVDVFEQHGIVRGVGRGSACASLVLYLIGVHMVDPILYDIPIGEFLR
jgi:DNA polymerase III alpha subunit